MPGYHIALFVHFLSLALAIVGASLATYAALRLRAAANLDQARQWLHLIGRVVRVFPIASIGLLATGAYMVRGATEWSTPWVLAPVIALAVIVVLGAGVEGSRSRALKRELQTSGWSDRAQRLVRDPFAWSAKMMTLTLLVAAMFIMTEKPSAETLRPQPGDRGDRRRARRRAVLECTDRGGRRAARREPRLTPAARAKRRAGSLRHACRARARCRGSSTARRGPPDHSGTSRPCARNATAPWAASCAPRP